jgi:dipeptidase
MTKRLLDSCILCLVLFLGPSCESCTVFIVGKDASIDGSVMVSHSNDGEFETDPRLVKVQARDYPTNATRPVFFSPENYPRYVGYDRQIPEYYPTGNQNVFEPIGYIPQVSHTYAYLEETYGAVNEHQVAIGESTCSGIFGAIPLGAPNGTALWSIDELTHIAMERTATAREAVQLMGKLAEDGGFYGAGEFEGTAESLAISDPREAWIFHILPDPTGTSAIWAAQRVPDDSFSVLANMFVIREVDPDDKDNFAMSDSVHQVALSYGWWTPADGLLDFTLIYSDGEYAHKYYSGRRVWGAYHLAAPSRRFPADYADLQSDPVYPVSVQPDTKLSVQTIFDMHRYTYQGTPYDLGAPGNLAAGPFGSPDRWKAGDGEKIVPGNWERPIGLYRTSDTYVVQCRAESSDAVLWFGPASALATVFTPFLVGMTDIPESFRSGHQLAFDRSSAFWAACALQNIANLKWSYMIKDIQNVQQELESESVALLSALRDEDSSTVERALLDNAAKTVDTLWNLQDQLLFKYASGFVNEPPDGMSQMVGYPAWWLQAVGYADGPPPPPTQPKCCRPTSEAGQDDAWQLTGKAAMRKFLEAKL